MKYAGTSTQTPVHSIDEMVALGQVVEAIMDRPLQPEESSRLKMIYQRARNIDEPSASLLALADVVA